MKITIKTIEHSKQRYPTVGDWVFKPNNDLEIKVSKMGNYKYEFLVGLHELIEAFLCKEKGISEQSVTDFDIEFEKNRIEGNTKEPGDDPTAPYFREHQTATTIEKYISGQIKVDWVEYDKVVNNL